MEKSVAKLRTSMRYLTYMLRRVFPERFTPSSPEFAIPVSSGDFPHLDVYRLPYLDGKAPVLHFGSALRQTELFPNLVAMPMPSLHLVSNTALIFSPDLRYYTYLILHLSYLISFFMPQTYRSVLGSGRSLALSVRI